MGVDERMVSAETAAMSTGLIIVLLTEMETGANLRPSFATLRVYWPGGRGMAI